MALLEHSNHVFIKYAITNSTQLLSMKKVHSVGCTEYFSTVLGRKVINPNYTISDKEFYEKQSKEILKANKLSIKELESKIKNCKTVTSRIPVLTFKYHRNAYLSEYVKRLANGICQDCKNPAPFISKQFNEPFLETHHIVPLSEGGDDVFENLIALCPNCHRKRHHG